MKTYTWKLHEAHTRVVFRKFVMIVVMNLNQAWLHHARRYDGIKFWFSYLWVIFDWDVDLFCQNHSRALWWWQFQRRGVSVLK